MSETVGETAAFLAGAAKPVSGQAATRGSTLRLSRLAKVGIACALCVAACATFIASQTHVTADNAVVSAYVLPVRSPIRGQVFDQQLRVGDQVAGSAVLARVADDVVSDEHLVDLRAQLAREEAERAASLAERRALLDLRAVLVSRSDEYRAAQAAFAAATAAEAVAQLEARDLRLQQARRDMGRKLVLGRLGDLSVVDMDHATLDARTAQADVAAQAARLASLRSEAEAAARGIFLTSGSNDVSYSTQRIDEIDLRLADIDRTTAALAAEEAETRLRLDAEARRFATLSKAEIGVPASGMVWKLGSANGERIGTGDTLAQIVDCGAAFIVAAIPQKLVPYVEVGSIARFRLAGETADREGRVLSVTGDANVSGDRNLAATPAPERVATAVVRIKAPASGNNGHECLVGRTARVLMPVAGGGLMARLLRWTW